MKSILTQLDKRPRFAPIRNLTPDKLVRMLDAFEQGYLAEAALAWETIEKRDETIKSVAPKRKKAVARHGWEVIVLPNLPCEAQADSLRHKAAPEYFYTNLVWFAVKLLQFLCAFARSRDFALKTRDRILATHRFDSRPVAYSLPELMSKFSPSVNGP